VKPPTCPTCGHTNDAATFIGVGQYQPNAGDISVCIKCTAIATFTGDDLEVRKATLDELAVFENLPPVRQPRAVIRAHNRAVASRWN
jgi:hypothetical protein